MNISNIEFAAAGLFVVAVLHTFVAGYFEQLAHRFPRHAGLYHLLGEVEVVFGFWALVFVLLMAYFASGKVAIEYVESRNFTEPLFVFVIMVMAATRPVIHLAQKSVTIVSRLIPLPSGITDFWVTLTLVPLLGSFITEPAAMTLGAFMLSARYYRAGISTRLKYFTLGVLFVNVSIGGVLTSYAAPPVLMVASVWGWDSLYMLMHFGWKAAIAVFLNTTIIAVLFRSELKMLPRLDETESVENRIPVLVVLIHLLFLFGVVKFSHHPVMFMGLFMFFLGYTVAYKRYQSPLMLREGFMVAFFLAGLVVLGGGQQWWLQDLLAGLSNTSLYFGATTLTAITDNAALTYLGSLVQGTSEGFKYALVAGAVTGGGLTVIANAPNPAGFAILREYFDGEAISPWRLFLAALGPTIVAVVAFQCL